MVIGSPHEQVSRSVVERDIELVLGNMLIDNDVLKRVYHMVELLGEQTKAGIISMISSR